jgi:hypothetical protein
MGFFGIGNSKPNVSSQEYKKVRGHLHAEGFSQRELAHMDMVFSGDLEKDGSSLHRGIDEKELREKIKLLRERPGTHSLESRKIDMIEEAFKKKM